MSTRADFPEQGKEDTVIWRYMGFAKFVSLLIRNALFFVRGDRLPDPFEGMPTVKNAEKIKSILQPFPNEGAEILWKSLVEGRKLREAFFINCWHINPHESAAMWQLYVGNTEGVAIKSNYHRFVKAFEETSRNIFVSEVKYLDYEEEETQLDPFIYFTTKQAYFIHEREFRALFYGVGDLQAGEFLTEAGIYIPLSLDMLVEEIYVCPNSEEWFQVLVASTVEKFNLKKRIVNSALYQKPNYK
jgi:hypothetical protein